MTHGWVFPVATHKAPACLARSQTLLTTARLLNLEPGIEGLVHVSEMDWTNKNVAPSKIVALGDEVEVMVLGDRRRQASYQLGYEAVPC